MTRRSHKLAVQARYPHVWCTFNTRKSVHQVKTRVYGPSVRPGCVVSHVLTIAEGASAPVAWEAAARNLGV